MKAYNPLENILIYPNPTSGLLNLDLGEIRPDLNVTLIGVQGNVIRTWSFENTRKATVDIQEENGMYLLNINDGESQTIFKVLKE